MPVQRCQRDGKQGRRWGASGKCYIGPNAKALAERQGRAIRASGYTGNRFTFTLNQNPLRADPTRTATLRRTFAQAISRRLLELKTAIRRLLVDEDVFGLREPRVSPVMLENQRWRFKSDAEKVRAFQFWLRGQLQQNVVGADPVDQLQDAYWHRYVQEGYRKGAARAFDDVRRTGLYSKGSVRDFFEGTKFQFLEQSFRQPVAIQKVKLLAGRVFTELQGISEATSTALTRELTDGLVQGLSPLDVARNINRRIDTIGRSRARTLARTETIRAHAEGQLDALEQLKVEEIGVMVEWNTAGDTLVCPLCAELEGVVLKTKEAHGLLPRHPNCRCAFLPANVGESTKGQVRGKQAVEQALDKSVKQEIPKRSKRTLKEQKRLTAWAGADKRINKRRPTSLLKRPVQPRRRKL